MNAPRRTDLELRESINTLEKMLLTHPSENDVLKRVTALLVELLAADYGFCYQCKAPTDDCDVPWDFVHSIERKEEKIQELVDHSTSFEAPPHHFNQLLMGRPILCEGEELAFVPSPNHHPEINNCLLVPLTDANTIYGVVYVANIPSAFCENVIKRLRPFLAATHCLLRTATPNVVPNQKRATLTPSQGLDSLGHLFKVFEALFDAVILVDDKENIVICNRAATMLFGMPKAEINGKHMSYFLPQGAPKVDSRTTRVIENTAAPNTVWRGIPVIRADRSRTLVDLSAFTLNTPMGCLRGFTMDDISERMQSAANYHDTLQRFQVLTNITPVAIVQVNTEWECTYANDAWCTYTQMMPEEANKMGWLKGFNPQDADNVLDNMRIDCTESGEHESEFRLITPLGKTTWVKAKACVVLNSNGNSDGLIITFNDITDRLQNEKRLQTIAERDELTGLVNRAFFNDRLNLALKGVRRFGGVALLFLDLDDFKHINDTLGHDAGDTLLEKIGERLTFSLRNVDTIARIGGDEFTLILTNVDNVNSVTIVADKLIEALAEPFVLPSGTIYASASVGIAYADKPDQEPKAVLKQADIALYKAKEAGKNHYRFYSEELDTTSYLNILLRQSLKDVDRHDFSLVYQPQVNATTGKIIGLEALSRWDHEDPRAQNADIETCIKIIEQTGLINEFSQWLFQQVFKDIGEWVKQGLMSKGFRVSVNISAKQFRNKNLAKQIHSECIRYRINPKFIGLEITESAIIEDPKLVSEILQQLSGFGFHISLDDFGTGYSSLSYLQKMSINELKIDRSFISDIGVDDEDQIIVQAIIKLAQTLGLNLVAEGVDNPHIRDWLLAQDCAIQQGFYFYRPSKKSIVADLLQKQKAHNPQKIVKLNR